MVWSVDAPDMIPSGTQEISLPGGSHHIVIRTGAPLRLFRSAEDTVGEEVGTAILGGLRMRPVRKAMARTASVGAILRPDALGYIRKGAPPELTGRHTQLADICCGSEADDRVAQIRATATSARRLEIFEHMLLHLFAGAIAPDPLIRRALLRLDRGARIDNVVAETGLSHRHFGVRFRDAIGIMPVEYRQVRRFDRLITALSDHRRSGLAEVALIAGYSDQSHMAREFRAFSDLSLREFERLTPSHSRHIPLPA